MKREFIDNYEIVVVQFYQVVSTLIWYTIRVRRETTFFYFTSNPFVSPSDGTSNSSNDQVWYNLNNP